MAENKSTGRKPGHNASPNGFITSPPVKPIAPTPEIPSRVIRELEIKDDVWTTQEAKLNEVKEKYLGSENTSNIVVSIPRPLILSARELMEYIEFNPFDLLMRDEDEYETLEEMMERKADEADESGLTDSIIENGILEPIEVLHREGDRPFLVDGHHRIASLLRHAPSMPIPITHQDA